MKKIILLGICIAALLLSAGCNSPPEEVNDNPSIDRTDTEDITESMQKGDPGVQPEEIKNMLSTQPEQYMIEYKAYEHTLEEKTYTWYARGVDLRIDTLEGNMQSRLYTNLDGSVSCYKSGADWTCKKMPDRVNQQNDLEKEIETIKSYIDTANATRQLPDNRIANITCKCYYTKIDDTPYNRSAGPKMYLRYCISPDGMLFYAEGETGSGIYYYGVDKYSTNVSDADYALPAEAKDE
jgi:hypothetical protein